MRTMEPSHRERLQACLAGELPDRTPVALWRHFPVDDQTPQSLAHSIAAFQNQYDFDLIKVTPSSSFCLKDWGARDEWHGSTEGTRDYTRPVIQTPQDWEKLTVLDPRKGHLARQLTCLRLLNKAYAPHTPILQTIFSPMAQAKNLVGKGNLQLHLRQHPEALHAGLEIITRSTIAFLEEAAKTGIDGIFYAIQHAQYGEINRTEFEAFCRPYDLRVLQAAGGFWLNMGHIHGENIMFDAVADYPLPILNWHDQHTPPTLAEAQQRYPGVVCGGLRRWETLVLGTPAAVQAEVRAAVQATGGRRLIIGTGCVMPITAPAGNIRAARLAADEERPS